MDKARRGAQILLLSNRILSHPLFDHNRQDLRETCLVCWIQLLLVSEV